MYEDDQKLFTEDAMRKLLALAVGLGLLVPAGFMVLPAKAQSVEPPHTKGAGSPYQTLKTNKKKHHATRVRRHRKPKMGSPR